MAVSTVVSLVAEHTSYHVTFVSRTIKETLTYDMDFICTNGHIPSLDHHLTQMELVFLLRCLYIYFKNMTVELLHNSISATCSHTQTDLFLCGRRVQGGVDGVESEEGEECEEGAQDMEAPEDQEAEELAEMVRELNSAMYMHRTATSYTPLSLYVLF